MKESKDTTKTASVDIELVTNRISKLEVDYGRDDLNQMRDKINELIEQR